MENFKEVSSSNAEESYQVGNVVLNSVNLVSLVIDGEERVCLAQLSNTLLKDYSYNEIHNRRVALGITCVQCTPLQLEMLRRAGAMPMSSRRCGMITKREAERLFKSFFNEITPPSLPVDFVFSVYHECGWGCTGYFIPSRYNSSRAKCIRCAQCNVMFSPNKFIFHCHKTNNSPYTHPDAANFNSWRRHIKLSNQGKSKEIEYAWEDVKALFNGGSRKRLTSSPTSSTEQRRHEVLTTPTTSCPVTTPSMTGVLYPPSRFCLPTGSYPGLHTLNPLFRPALGSGIPGIWTHSSTPFLEEMLHKPNSLLAPSWNHPLLAQFRNHQSGSMLNNVKHSLKNTKFSNDVVRPASSSASTDSKESVDVIPVAGIKRPWIDTEVEEATNNKSRNRECEMPADTTTKHRNNT